MEQQRSPVAKLREISSKLGKETEKLALHVLDHPLFALWSGSGLSFVHHYGRGQLAQHTLEVVELALLNNECFKALGKGVRDDLLFLAALFHDVGKIRDYTPLPPDSSVSRDAYQEWVSTESKSKIYHITHSALAWNEAFNEDGHHLSTEEKEEVLHAILAHHGRHEWKSPVEPKTRMAWLLHLSDNMSARIDDCVKVRPKS